MRYRLAVALHTIARWLHPAAGISVTEHDHDGVHTVRVDIDNGHRLVGNWRTDPEQDVRLALSPRTGKRGDRRTTHRQPGRRDVQRNHAG